MPGSDKIKCETILGGYEEIDERGTSVCGGRRLPIMAVIVAHHAFVPDINTILYIVISGGFPAIIGHISLFFCRMCAVGVQGWQQLFPGATDWFPRLLPGDFSRNSLWLF